MKQNYPRALWWLTVATFLVPLIVVPSYFIFPFIVPKVLVFRTLVLCQMGIWLVWFFSRRGSIKIRKSPISMAVLFFFASFALSTFFGTDWYHSFWDNHERMLGLFTIAHYVLYYFIITTTFRGMEIWRRLLFYFVAAATVVIAIGVWQKINPTFLLNNNSGRTSATLGNAIYLGGYGVWLFFVSCYLAITEKSLWRRCVLGGIAVLSILGIIASGTRGSVLGMAAGLVVMFAVYFFTLPKEQQKQRRIIGMGAAGIMLVILILFLFRTNPAVRNIPAVGSLLNINIGASTASTRIMAWEIAWKASKDYPVFGWGPNNFFYAFNKYYNPKFLEHGWGETWFDNAHNIIMNTLTTQGAVGVAAYLSLFGAALWQLFRGLREKRISYHFAALSGGWLVAHLTQNVFVFENITSYLVFFFYLAFINSVTEPDSDSISTETEKSIRLNSAMVWFIWILIGLAIFTTNINAGRANMAMVNVLRTAYKQGDIETSYARALSFGSPHYDDNRSDAVRLIMQIVPHYAQNGKGIEAQKLVELGIREIDKNRILHPLDIRNQVQEVQLLQMSFDLFKNVDHVLKSEQLLEEARELSPQRQQIDYMLAVTKSILGKHAEAVEILKKSVAVSPAVGEGWWRLAYALRQAGDMESAKRTIQEARASGIVFDGVGLSIANQILPPTNTP